MYVNVKLSLISLKLCITPNLNPKPFKTLSNFLPANGIRCKMAATCGIPP